MCRTDLVGLYTLDETSGIIASDSSPLNNPAIIIHGNTGWTPQGKIGGAYNFSGVCGVIQRPITNDFTIMFWMKTSNVGPNGQQWWEGFGLVDAEVANTVNDFGTSIINNKVAFGMGPYDTTLKSMANVSDGNWHHVVAVRSVIIVGSQPVNSMTLYIDGVKNNFVSMPANRDTQPRDASPDITFGCIQETRSHFYYGLLDQIRIYNNTVNQTIVTQIYSIEKTGINPDAPTATTVPTFATSVSPTVVTSAPSKPTIVTSATSKPPIGTSTSIKPTAPIPTSMPPPTRFATSYATTSTDNNTSNNSSKGFVTAEIFAIIFGFIALIEGIALALMVVLLLKRRRISYFQMDNMSQSVNEEF